MWRIVLFAAVAAGMTVAARPALAQTDGGTLFTGSYMLVVGQTSHVGLVAQDVPGPDTIAYSVTMQFDPSVIEISSCSADTNDTDSICEQPDESAIIFSSPSGDTPTTSNDWSLGDVTLACTGTGVSAVTISISSWESAMTEPPARPAVENSLIRCVDHLPVLRVESQTGVVGEPVSVNIDLVGMPAPGLGAWIIDITYDPTALQITGCTRNVYSVCSTHYASNKGRLRGATVNGLTGTATLGSFSFSCRTVGTSRLTLTTNVFADATMGNPQPIIFEIENGIITCVAASPTPAVTATPTLVDHLLPLTPTPTSVALPSAGSGGAANSPASRLPVALLGVAGVLALGVAYSRRRR